MGFLSALFGKKSSPTNMVVEPIEYNGFFIYPEPIKEGGMFRIAGRITQQSGGKSKEHRFIRSDVLGSEADATELMITKAKMFIDQSGDKMFQ